MKLCEIYDEGCSSLSFDYTCKIRDGTELEMETQSDTRYNLKTTMESQMGQNSPGFHRRVIIKTPFS